MMEVWDASRTYDRVYSTATDWNWTPFWTSIVFYFKKILSLIVICLWFDVRYIKHSNLSLLCIHVSETGKTACFLSLYMELYIHIFIKGTKQNYNLFWHGWIWQLNSRRNKVLHIVPYSWLFLSNKLILVSWNERSETVDSYRVRFYVSLAKERPWRASNLHQVTCR